MTPDEKRRLFARIDEGKSSLLPQFSGHWEHVNTLASWRIYIVHDPCHDGGDFQDDRNTVVALHDGHGLWRIIGRELPYELALDIAEGRH